MSLFCAMWSQNHQPYLSAFQEPERVTQKLIWSCWWKANDTRLCQSEVTKINMESMNNYVKIMSDTWHSLQSLQSVLTVTLTPPSVPSAILQLSRVDKQVTILTRLIPWQENRSTFLQNLMLHLYHILGWHVLFTLTNIYSIMPTSYFRQDR